MTKMMTVKSHRYGGRDLRAGDEFEIFSDRDKRVLEALGRAQEVVPKPPEPTKEAEDGPAAAQTVNSKPEVAEPPPEVEEKDSDNSESADAKSRRNYKRRDMTANS